MYCKYCGKQIDDDSKFCKECGKSLNHITNSSNGYMGFFQKHLVLIALIVIWYFIGYLYSSAYYDRENSGIILGMYMVTPIIMGLLYWIYKQNCKYQIKLFNKTDSTKVKMLKYAYLAYTYFIPFSCSDGLGNDFFVYFIILGLAWLVPTLIVCGIYYYIQSKKAIKSSRFL
jgi:predicted nucleic acid-binding Zn ribbon protein